MNPELTANERRYLDLFQDIHPALVGIEIGRGAQHIVRAYGPDQVIKIPRAVVRRDIISLTASRIITPRPKKLQEDLDTSREYFGDDTVLPTTICTDTRSRVYVMLQPRMDDFQPLTPELVESDPDLANELREVVESGNRLFKDNDVFLDMMGWNPRRIVSGKPYLDNVVKVPVSNGKKLKLPDITLFPKPDFSLLGVYFQRVLEFQRRNMRKFKLTFAE